MLTEELKKRIQDQLSSNKYILYMKGTADVPMCGFSAQVVSILKSYNIPFTTFNILEDMNIRNGLKEYSDWPTFPQFYVNGELIGGCDIVSELHTSGELKEILSK